MVRLLGDVVLFYAASACYYVLFKNVEFRYVFETRFLFCRSGFAACRPRVYLSGIPEGVGPCRAAWHSPALAE